jgi:membrane associated rhomboid family serine protease
MLLAGSRARNWEIVGELVLLSGVLLWIFGRPAIHVGASTLIFGLAVFLVVSGFRERRPLTILIAVLVLFFYGGSVVAGILPRIGSSVSWDGHLAGAVAGGLIGYSLTRQGRQPEPS